MTMRAQNEVAPGPTMGLFMGLLIVTTALGPFALQIFLPALPIIQDDFGVSAVTAQLVFSLSAFAIAVATLFYGPISDRFGRRPTMLWGIVIFGIGSAICALAPTIEWLIIGRIVQAGGGCAGMVLSRAMIRDTFDREHSATAIAYVTMAMVAAPMVAPALGGVLTELTNWRIVFWAGIAVGLVVGLIAFLRLPETRLQPASGHVGWMGMLGGFRKLLSSRLFLAYAFQGAFSMAVFFAFLGGAPYVMLKVFGLSAAEYGLYFMTVSGAFMAGNFLAARATRILGIDQMILWGSIGTTIGCLTSLALVSGGWFAHWGLFGPMILTAFAQGMAVPNAQAAIVSTNPEIAGTASGLGGFLQMGTAATTAQIVGSIQTGTAMPVALGMSMTALACLACAIAAWTLAKR